MCIIKKVFYYEETKLPAIEYKDEIWVRAKTVANTLRYKYTMKSIRDHVDPEDKRDCHNWNLNPSRTKRSPQNSHPWKEREKHYLYQRFRIIQSNTSL